MSVSTIMMVTCDASGCRMKQIVKTDCRLEAEDRVVKRHHWIEKSLDCYGNRVHFCSQKCLDQFNELTGEKP